MKPLFVHVLEYVHESVSGHGFECQAGQGFVACVDDPRHGLYMFFIALGILNKLYVVQQLVGILPFQAYEGLNDQPYERSNVLDSCSSNDVERPLKRPTVVLVLWKESVLFVPCLTRAKLSKQSEPDLGTPYVGL